MNRQMTAHPGEEYLLRYADGELGSRESAQVREHLEACWGCQAELEDLQQTITDYVAYHEATLNETPDPPPSWGMFNIHLERLIAQRERSWWRRTSRLLSGFLQEYRVPVASLAGAALFCFVIVVLNRPATVNAAELLNKAFEHERGVTHSRQLRIRTRTRTFVRPAGGGIDQRKGGDESVRAYFLAANYNWENPLSAVSFSEWRRHLADRRDEVDILPNPTRRGSKVYQIRTKTGSSALEEATLSIQIDDYDVVSGTFHFRNDEWVEVTALPDQPAPVAVQDAPATAQRQPMRSKPADETEPTVVDEPAQELHVMAALRRAEADLGEQIEMNRRQDGKLVVTSTGLTPDRQDTLRRSFTDLPEVVLRFYQPPMAALTIPDSQGPNPPRNNSPGGLTALQLQFERSLGGAEAFEHFANELLETSQGAMGRAHALARLAQHFPPDVEAKLTKEDDEVLVRLRRDHVQGMSQNVKYIVRRMAAVLDAGVIGRQPIERAPEPATWWEASRNLLAATRQMDHFLTLLLTGAADDSSGHLLTDAERALWVVDAEVSRSEGIIAGAPEGRR